MVTMYMYDVLYGEVKDVLSAKTTARPPPPLSSYISQRQTAQQTPVRNTAPP